MQKSIEQVYRSKLQNIEEKFKLISQAYTKLAGQIGQKNEIIQDLNRVIHVLESNLEQSNIKLYEAKANIQKLQAKLDKETIIKKVFIGTQNKSSTFVPQAPKTSITNLPLNSQTSIIPKIAIEKNRFQIEESKQMRRKYENLAKNVSAESKEILSGDKSKRFEKVISNLQLEENFAPQQFNDLTNIRIYKSSFKAKQKQISGLSTQPITHQEPSALNSNLIVNKETTMKTLTKIWQQRDRQIQKMDELFQSINSKLKQFEQ